MTQEQKSPMTEKELAQSIAQYGDTRFKSGQLWEGHRIGSDLMNEKSLQYLNEIKQQLSLLYAKAERWDMLKDELKEDIETFKKQGLPHSAHYKTMKEAVEFIECILQKMTSLESTQTETKTEGQ